MNKQIKPKPMLTLKTDLKAGADPRGYCLQGCFTGFNSCQSAGGTNCDQSYAVCLNDCIDSPPSLL